MLSDGTDDRSMESQLTGYIRILSKLNPSTRLRTLILTFKVLHKKPPLEGNDLGEIADWTPLDEIFAQDHFSSLQIVKINFYTKDWENRYDLGVQILPLLEPRLPTLFGRRILQSWNDVEADWTERELSRTINTRILILITVQLYYNASGESGQILRIDGISQRIKTQRTILLDPRQRCHNLEKVPHNVRLKYYTSYYRLFTSAVERSR